MKRLFFDFSKRNSKAVLGTTALVLLFTVFAVTFVGCNNDGDKTNPSTGINEETYVFAEGITLGTIDLSGRVYKDVKALAEQECLDMVSDFTLGVTAEEKDFEFTKDSFVWDTNVEESLKLAVDHTEKINNGEKTEGKLDLELEFNVDEDSVKEAAAAVAAEVDILPVNANIDTSGESIKFTEEKAGYQVDQEKLVADMTKEIDMLSVGEKASATVEAVMKETQPEVTREDIDGNVTLLSSFTTIATSSSNSMYNMNIAAQACNGSIIQPGEVWSFNESTGDSNQTSLGYVSSTVIMNGEYAQGVGGGICQTSTTIYNAALLANLEIVERYCHYFQSSYVDAGLDATIDYPNLDLKLRNITEYPIYLQCYMEGNELTCDFYGWQDPSFDEIKVTSSIYETNPAENYYRASAWRTYYKDGVEVKSEQLRSSTYAYTSPTEPTESTAAEETTVPVTTTPSETTVPLTTTAPTEPDVPVETTAPVIVTPPETTPSPTE